MKKIMMVLIMGAFAVTSFSKSYIEDTKFIIDKNKIKIVIESSKDDMLSITVVKNVFFARKKYTKLQRKIHNIARKSTQKMCIFLLTHC